LLKQEIARQAGALYQAKTNGFMKKNAKEQNYSHGHVVFAAIFATLHCRYIRSPSFLPAVDKKELRMCILLKD
jgi:hypothetical protein